jgi:hypothetical protein
MTFRGPGSRGAAKKSPLLYWARDFLINFEMSTNGEAHSY